MLNENNIREKLFHEITFLHLHPILHDVCIKFMTDTVLPKNIVMDLNTQLRKLNLTKFYILQSHRVLLPVIR